MHRRCMIIHFFAECSAALRSRRFSTPRARAGEWWSREGVGLPVVEELAQWRDLVKLDGEVAVGELVERVHHLRQDGR